MASVNKVILVGNCGRDPEVRYTPSGTAIVSMSLATSSRRKDKSTGEYVDDTQWHRLTFIDRLAEIAGEYLKKGKQVYVEGWLKYGKFTDKDGIERYTTDIVVNSLQLLGAREEGEGRAPAPKPAAAPAPQRNGYAAAKEGRAPAPAPKSSTGFDDMDDDIPF
jgi:single-strand DNA-binding protein